MAQLDKAFPEGGRYGLDIIYSNNSEYSRRTDTTEGSCGVFFADGRRQPDGEDGASSLLTPHTDVSPVLTHDAEAAGQTRPGCPEPLGGPQRLEDLAEKMGRDEDMYSILPFSSIQYSHWNVKSATVLYRSSLSRSLSSKRMRVMALPICPAMVSSTVRVVSCTLEKAREKMQKKAIASPSQSLGISAVEKKPSPPMTDPRASKTSSRGKEK